MISGNGGSGVVVRGSGTHENLVTASLIGTNAAGTAALPNAQDGVDVGQGAAETIIGNAGIPDLRNSIAGNARDGIRVSGGATLTAIRGNEIGTDPSGTLELGNGGDGVLFAGSSGSYVQANRITFNGGDGVQVDGTAGPANADSIIGNEIDDNGGLGSGSWPAATTARRPRRSSPCRPPARPR